MNDLAEAMEMENAVDLTGGGSDNEDAANGDGDTAFLLAWTRSACTPAGRCNVVQSGFDGGDMHRSDSPC